MERAEPAHRYNLIAVCGLVPQVITETIYSFARQREPMYPAAVHVITTADGANFVEAGLFGEERYYRGQIIREAAERWEAFCEEVLPAHPTFSLHTPEHNGEQISDIRSRSDDEEFANYCYELVAELTGEDQMLPLIGSIAGGRKTMSAHLKTAFSVYARPQDRLVHVLVSPKTYENDPTFYYPSEETPDARIDRVGIPFPRLYRLLREDVFAKLPEDRHDLRSILDTLEPINYETAPTRARIEIGILDRAGSRLRLMNEDEELAQCTMTPTTLATLLVFAEQIAAHDGKVPIEDLAAADEVHEQRKAVVDLCTPLAYPSRWDYANDVSRARYNLHEALEEVPMALEFLSFDTESGGYTEPSYYRWKTPPPLPLDLVIAEDAAEMKKLKRWPFNYVSRPREESLTP